MFRLAAALLVAVMVLLVAAASALAHVVETVDGDVYEGKIVLDGEKEIVIATTFDGRKNVPIERVKRVDRDTPPLRDQLVRRAQNAKDSVGDLWKVHAWAKKKGFRDELKMILKRILVLNPKSSKAHKLLGHEKIDGVWLSQEEKEALEKERHEAEMRAKGLVPYFDRWVTPREKDALERGLIQDGDDWVTEEEYHRRRGEQLIDGEWVRIGEEEGKAWHKELLQNRVRVEYLWGPNVDIYYDTKPEIAKQALDGAEAALKVAYRLLEPEPRELPQGLAGRMRLHLFVKQPAYARFAKYFDKREKCSELVKGWVRRAQRQHAFWWVQPTAVIAAYKFPNTTRTVVSNLVHNVGFSLLTLYNFNYRFPKAWLQEGFAYYLEMEAYGYSDTFNLHRAGTAAANASGAPVWIDSNKWKRAIKKLVVEGRDPPLKRMARMDAEQLGYAELVKSWSVVSYLAGLGNEKFQAFLRGTKDREKARPEEESLKEVYGLSWRQLDQKWRAWVQTEYLTPEEKAALEEAEKEQ